MKAVETKADCPRLGFAARSTVRVCPSDDLIENAAKFFGGRRTQNCVTRPHPRAASHEIACGLPPRVDRLHRRSTCAARLLRGPSLQSARRLPALRPEHRRGATLLMHRTTGTPCEHPRDRRHAARTPAPRRADARGAHERGVRRVRGAAPRNEPPERVAIGNSGWLGNPRRTSVAPATAGTARTRSSSSLDVLPAPHSTATGPSAPPSSRCGGSASAARDARPASRATRGSSPSGSSSSARCT
jgi:hypothetical protein